MPDRFKVITFKPCFHIPRSCWSRACFYYIFQWTKITRVVHHARGVFSGHCTEIANHTRVLLYEKMRKMIVGCQTRRIVQNNTVIWKLGLSEIKVPLPDQHVHGQNAHMESRLQWCSQSTSCRGVPQMSLSPQQKLPLLTLNTLTCPQN